MSARVGVLALQGDVAENAAALKAAGAEACEVRRPEQLRGLDGLVMPGGESTTVGGLCEHNGLLQAVREEALSGMPLLGICAGMVMMAGRARDSSVGGTEQPLLGLVEMDLERNSFGRQRSSFKASVSLEPLGIGSFGGVFIRAPSASSVGDGVEAVSSLDGRIVAVRKGSMIGTAFHPELGGDLALHRHFVDLARAASRGRA